MAIDTKMCVTTAVTFGRLLGGLWDNVNDTIQQATNEVKNAGIELEMEAGR